MKWQLFSVLQEYAKCLPPLWDIVVFYCNMLWLEIYIHVPSINRYVAIGKAYDFTFLWLYSYFTTDKIVQAVLWMSWNLLDSPFNFIKYFEIFAMKSRQVLLSSIASTCSTSDHRHHQCPQLLSCHIHHTLFSHYHLSPTQFHLPCNF